MHILLADDHPEFQRAAERFLRLDPRVRGISLARTGQEAIELADRVNPDLVLLDLYLPRISGWWAAWRIAGGNESVEVWLLSSQDNPEYGRAARASGAAGCISKTDFVERIGAILQDRHARAERGRSRTGFPAGGNGGGAFRASLGPAPFAPPETGPKEAGPGPAAGEPPGKTIPREALESLEQRCQGLLNEMALFRRGLRGGDKTGDSSVKDGGVERWVVCRSGRETFALALQRVVQVKELPPFAALPADYAPLAGILPVDGEAVPLVDFKKKWNPAESRHELPGRLVLLRSASGLLGLLVDEVPEVITVAAGLIRPLVLLPVSGTRPWLERIVPYKDSFLFGLDVDSLLPKK